MSSRRRSAPSLTPQGQLEEGPIHPLLGYRLAQASLVADAAFARTAGQALGLRPVGFTLLQLIDANPDVTPTRLAKALSIKAPAITVWLDKLQAQGLLSRAPHADDGRAQQLQLTAEGASRLRAARRLLLAEDERLLAALTPEERASLLHLLGKVAALRGAS